jgi:hypothetical protein
MTSSARARSIHRTFATQSAKSRHSLSQSSSSSAREIRASGTSIPSVFAVVRLITSSNLAGQSINLASAHGVRGATASMRSQMGLGLIVCRSLQFIKILPFHGDRLEHIPHAPQCERASSWVHSLCAAFVLSRATRSAISSMRASSCSSFWVSRHARMIPRPLQIRAPTWLSRVPSAIARVVFARPFVT